MVDSKFTITCPLLINNKVTVIKAIRTLTGLGLKEAKDASEKGGRQVYDIHASNFLGCVDPEKAIEEQFRILRSEGVEVGEPAWKIIQDLRELGAKALQMGEDELANEILQLVLAEKLRRAQ